MDSSTALVSIPFLEAIVTMVFTKRAPSEPKSLNNPSSAKTFLVSPILRKIVKIASIPFPLSISFFREPVARPSDFSIGLVPFRNSVTNLPKAVAATSGSNAMLSTAAPSARISGVVRAACSPRASIRLEKSTILPLVAVDVEAKRKIAEPVFSMACSTPYFFTRPITSVILANAVSASSPKSSLSATFTWSATRTKPASAIVPPCV